MLRHRLIFGALMILAMAAVVGLDSRWAPHFPLLLAASSLLVWRAAHELCAMLHGHVLRLRAHRLAEFGCLAILWSNWLPSLVGAEMADGLNLAAPSMKPALAAFVGVTMWAFVLTAWRYREPGDAVLGIAGYLIVFFYVGLLAAFFVQLRWLGRGPGSMGAAALLLAALTPKACDIGAYFTGRAFGRTPLWPALSPKKSVEGAIGGLALAVAAAYWLGTGTAFGLTAQPLLRPWAAAAFGLLVGLTGMVGDLMESLLKRDCERKDSASSIPGFGGLLDVVDSVLFSAPVSYLLLVSLRQWTWG
jgi:phosphatidate cytidylyltransferase